MSNPYRLAVSITSASGQVYRWGPDEIRPDNVPTGMSFSTSIPGGFKDLTLTLPRKIDQDYSDLNLFDTVRVYGPGNQTAWEGRVAQLPREHGDGFSIQVGCVGWAAHLKDDASFREIYVDRDLTAWGGDSVQRKLNLLGASIDVDDPSVVPDSTTGAPSLKTSMTGAWSRARYCEALYDAGGIPLSQIIASWKLSAAVSAADTNWQWQVYLGTGDVLSAFDTSGNLLSAGPGLGETVTTTATTRTFGLINMAYVAANTTDGVNYDMFWTALGVYGRHGLTQRYVNGASLTATELYGFYVSDIVADIVSRAAPLLSYTTGAGGSIEDTSFVIPHLVFKDPLAAEDAIQVVNAYHLYEWGVYDDREFFYRAPDPDRLTWEARLSDGAKVSFEGDTGEQLFNGVYVTYTDPSGAKKTVGPPGSTADATDSSLQDTSETNPVNAHGIPRRWAKLDISATTTQAGAIQLGATWLAEHSLPTRRGTIELTGLVQHPTKGKRPVWELRAGDYIRISDHPADTPRRVIETRYDHDSRKLTASIDNTVFKLDALLERLGVLVGVL